MTTTNPLKRFKALLNQKPATIVTITANNGNGTSAATTSDGAIAIIQGESVAIGQKAIIEGDRIIAAAPTLPYSEVTIF